MKRLQQYYGVLSSALTALTASIVLASGTGCAVDPFCLDCVDGMGLIVADGGSDAGDLKPPPRLDLCIPTGIETCNGIDDDCNGLVDDGTLPQIGDVCGTDEGECVQGVKVCTDGKILCDSPHPPVAETCNGLDDDCDGVVDNGNPGGGLLCGNGVGVCVQGLSVCKDGSVQCEGGTGPSAEICDGLDNDCNGEIDDGNPGGGASCGAGPGVCVLGTVTCVGASLQCIGAGPPVDEVCNGIDDNCNGLVDEGFNTAIDVNNCKVCGRKCVADNAIPRCQAGECEIDACTQDHWDVDGNPENGCEYTCVYRGVELCNGIDDDCDGEIDDAADLTPPNTCIQQGECAGTKPTCDGSKGWVCHYGGNVSHNTDDEIIPETDCDNKDNDCNGTIDDLFPNRTKPCTRGLGVCKTTGTQVCNATNDALDCTAATPPTGTPEVCDGLDNDCNGLLDDGAPDAWVAITVSGNPVEIYQYEASRPDATGAAIGGLTHRSCSAPNRLPWTNVTHAEATAACAAAGGRLCTEAEWEGACNAASGTCNYSQSSGCTSNISGVCNDQNYDANSMVTGVQNNVVATGTLPMCYADWGGSKKIFDLSGNVKEWTAARAPDVLPQRGGNYNSPPGGTTCSLDFIVTDSTFQFVNVGFRCCR